MKEQTVRRSGESPSPPIAEQVMEHLAPYLGDFNARVWVKVVAERDLGVEPDEVGTEDLAPLLEGLRASLNTFLGRAAAGDLCRRIMQEVG